MEIIINKLNFGYDNLIFNNLDLKIESNKITSIIGKNGSGKTTLLQLITGLLLPSNGTIQIDKYVIDNRTKIKELSKIRKNIGLVFQFPEEQFFNLTVKDEIAYALKTNDYQAKEIDKRIEDSLKMLDLDISILNKSPFKLSSGQMRKVAIASILIYNPKIIIMDEPTIGLDDESKNHIIKIIKKLKNKYNKTIIISSHDTDFINKISDNIVVLSNGKIMANGIKKQVLKERQLFENLKIELPKAIQIVNLIKDKHNVKLPFREEVNDIIKDIYRNVK